MSKFANKLTILDEYINFLSEKHGVSMDETHGFTVQEIFNNKSLFEAEEDEEIEAKPGDEGKGEPIDVKDSDVVSSEPGDEGEKTVQPRPDVPTGGSGDEKGGEGGEAEKTPAGATGDAGGDEKKDAETGADGEAEKKAAQAAGVDGPEDLKQDPNAKKAAQDAAKKAGEGELEPDPRADAMADQAETAFERSMRKNGLVGTMAKPVLGVVEKGLKFLFGSGVFDDPADANPLMMQVNRNPYLAPYYLSAQLGLISQAAGNSPLGLKSKQVGDDLENTGDKIKDNLPDDPGGDEEGGDEEGGDAGSDAGEAWDMLDIAKFYKQHPQIMSAGFALMPKNKAIEIFNDMKKYVAGSDENTQYVPYTGQEPWGQEQGGWSALSTEIIQRLVDITSIPAVAAQKISKLLGIELPVERVRINGNQRAVDILKTLGQQWETSIFTDLTGRNTEAAEKLRSMMFVFKEIANLQDREVQMILREVHPPQLAMALQGESDDLKEYILSQMGSRQARVVMDEIEAGQDSWTEEQVKKAKIDVVEIIMNLAEEGKVNTRPEIGPDGRSSLRRARRKKANRGGKIQESRLRNALYKLITESLKTEVNIVNETNEDMSELVEMMNQFFPYSKDRLGFNRPVTAELKSDPANAADPLGKTAYYDPNKMHIVLFTDKRHPKDVLRSFSHELVHHSQNCRGEFDNGAVTEEGYAQNNKHLRKMEKEAYLEGQLILRDWEDSKKENKSKMNEKTIRNIARRVMESVKNEVRTRADGELPTNDPHRGSHGRGRQELPEANIEEEETLQEEDSVEEGDISYKRDNDEALDEGGAAARTGNEEKDQGRERMTVDRVHEGGMGHDCGEVHPDEEHDVWEQKERIGPVAHTPLSENKSNYDLFLKKKDNMIFEKLVKKWCK